MILSNHRAGKSIISSTIPNSVHEDQQTALSKGNFLCSSLWTKITVRHSTINEVLKQHLVLGTVIFLNETGNNVAMEL